MSGRSGTKPGGMFVVIEGADGVGKTTLVNESSLAARLSAETGREVLRVREPGGTPAGEAIRRILMDPSISLTPEAQLLLFSAARAELLRTVVRPALERGAIVMADRFLLSTYVYQGRLQDVSPKDIQLASQVAIGDLRPHTILLTLGQEERNARRKQGNGGGEDRFEAEQFQDAVHLAYEEEAALRLPDAMIVSASGTPAEVSDRVLSLILDRFLTVQLPHAVHAPTPRQAVKRGVRR